MHSPGEMRAGEAATRVCLSGAYKCDWVTGRVDTQNVLYKPWLGFDPLGRSRARPAYHSSDRQRDGGPS